MLEGKEISGKFAGGDGEYGADITPDGKLQVSVVYSFDIGAAARKLSDSSSNSIVKKLSGIVAGAFGK